MPRFFPAYRKFFLQKDQIHQSISNLCSKTWCGLLSYNFNRADIVVVALFGFRGDEGSL